MSGYGVPQAISIGRAAMLQPRQLSDPEAPKEKSLTELGGDIRAFLDQQPLKTGCAFCDWTHDGTAAEGRTAARAHRAQEHPSAKNRVGRRRISLKQRGQRTDEENALAALDAADARRRRAEKEDADRLAKVQRARDRGDVIGPHHDARDTGGKEAEGTPAAEDAGTGVAGVSSTPDEVLAA